VRVTDISHSTHVGNGSDVRPRSRLGRLLDPRSIAVVGASEDPAKRGYQILSSLARAGYRHPVYPVNPKGGSILGHPVLASISDLPPGVDAALVATPAATVPQVVAECAAAGVAGVVVVANGFRESGDAGAELEDELRAVVEETGIRVVGPNTSGILVTPTGADLVGLGQAPPGQVSVVTQSGNMLLSHLADDRAAAGAGIDTYVGLGNQMDVSYAECLDHLSRRATTAAIALHCEGMTDGRQLLVAAARASRRRPVVMLRGGRSQAGQQAALSHTGSAAVPDAIAAPALRQAGVELVERSDELALVAAALATTPPVQPGRGVAILSDGGGHATLAVDALTGAEIDLATLTDDTRARLRALLGPNAAVGNPIDVAGATDRDPERFVPCVEALAVDPGVGLVLLIGLFGGYHLRFDPALRDAEDRTAEQLVEFCREHELPLVVHSCYAGDRPPSHAALRRGGVPVLGSLDHAVRIVDSLARRGRFLATVHDRSHLRLPEPPLPSAAVTDGDGDGAPTTVLDEPSARQLLHDHGIDTGPWRVAHSPEEARTAVASFDRPCALKVISPDVVHKSDVGGVRLQVTPDAAAEAHEEVVRRVATSLPDADVTGILVTPMADPGVELLVGATVDPLFGPVVAFGSGGVLVDALRDLSFRAAPLSLCEAREMIAETLATRLMDGYRGLPPVDRPRLAELLVQVGDLMARTPQIRELDLNPVVAHGRTLTPVDVRIVLARPPGDDEPR
jgi:acetate---CoA ligase (ADP-forming)